MADSEGTTPAPDRRETRLVRQINRFAAAHGGAADATVAYLGARGARIVLIAADGTWGDLVAPTLPLARAAATRSAAAVHDDFAAPLAAKVRTGPYEWSRMAGTQIGGRANT
jgi:hypothetical protein